MPSTTADYALPYPVPTDPTNVPGDIQALALRAAAVIKANVTVGIRANRPAPAGIVVEYYATDEARLYVTDGTAWFAATPLPAAPPTIPLQLPFHVAFAVNTGLKIPKFIATRNATLRLSRAVCDTGSGVVYRLYVNGGPVAAIPDSAPVGTTSVVNNFTATDINAGDTVQVYVSNAGTSANDLSVTVDAVYR
jgi:hypothetical protein